MLTFEGLYCCLASTSGSTAEGMQIQQQRTNLDPHIGQTEGRRRRHERDSKKQRGVKLSPIYHAHTFPCIEM